MVGKVLKDRYELIAQLGKGGMSVVYLARDKILGSYWAVKCVKKNSDVDINAFKKEVELLSSLNHSDIPRIVDRIEEKEYYFVVMDFVDGVALSKKIKTEGPISEKDVVHYMVLLCDILDYLHTARDNPIVYRDIKPENLMLTPVGRVKLIDFGIAKECKRGQKDKGPKVGTKGYAAPEQYSSGVLDERTDIYSLGVTIFSLVTGKAPSKPVKRGQIIRVPLIRDVDPGLSEGLEYIVEKCTQIKPEDRYKDCKELQYDLQNIERLNSSYKKSMLSKLMFFSSAILLCIVSVIFIGMGRAGIEAEQSQGYQDAYARAYNYEIQGDYPAAITGYIKAIEHKPDEEEAYVKWFGAMVMQAGDNASDLTEAINQAKSRYIENKNSKMQYNPRLMYVVAKKCMEIKDAPVMYQRASDYFNRIQKYIDSTEDGQFNQSEIASLALIAESFGTESIGQDFVKMQNAMNSLEENTKVGHRMEVGDQIGNYYNLVFLYNIYATKLPEDSGVSTYERTNQIGIATKDLVGTIQDDQQMDEVFDSVIKLYQVLTINQIKGATSMDDVLKKEEFFQNTIKWFDELDSLSVQLTVEDKLRKADAYRGIFDIHKSSDSTVGEIEMGYLKEAISLNLGVSSLTDEPDDPKLDANKFTAALNLVRLYCSQSVVEQTYNTEKAREKLKEAKVYLDKMDKPGNRTIQYNSAETEIETVEKYR